MNTAARNPLNLNVLARLVDGEDMVVLANGQFKTFADVVAACQATLRGMPEKERKQLTILCGYADEDQIVQENFTHPTARAWDSLGVKSFADFLHGCLPADYPRLSVSFQNEADTSRAVAAMS